jgi:Leucine rich repeat
VVDLPAQPPTTCDIFQFAGLNGYIDADACPAVVQFTENCGCVEGTVAPGPTAPVPPTTLAPVAASTTSAPVINTITPRDQEIMVKCGTTAEARSTAILNGLALLSDSQALATEGSPQYLAREWIDNVDGAVICPDLSRIAQRYAAAVLYYGMDGGEWVNCRAEVDGGSCTNVTSGREPIRFLSSEHECKWFGCGCGDNVTIDLNPDDLRHLTLIELPDNNLGGAFVTELFSLTKLTALTMDGNKRIAGTIPSAIGDLTDLRYLDLDDNMLTGELPSQLWQMTDLRVLDVNTNSFVGTLPSDIGNLLNLNVLQLENNMFTGPVPADALKSLTKMGTLLCTMCSCTLRRFFFISHAISFALLHR